MKKSVIIIMILSVLLIATNVIWFVVHFQGVEGWNRVYESDYVTAYLQRWNTDTFVIDSEEWFIEWQGQPEWGTLLVVEVNDAYSDALLQSFNLYPESRKHYLNITGRFYLSFYTNQEGLSVKVEVWES